MVVVSFGTTYKETRERTLDVVESDFRGCFKEYDVYRAYTSRIVKKILKERDNIEVFNVKEALEHLLQEGYQKVVLQSLHIMNAIEYQIVKNTIKKFEDKFEYIVLGKALLTSDQDYSDVVESMSTILPTYQEGQAVVMMGHGTHHNENSAYTKLNDVFEKRGYKNIYIGTVEAEPTIEDILVELEKNNIKKVTLMPFMMVAGDHATNDLAGDEEDSWKSILLDKGYEVDIYLHGIAEIRGIRNIFIAHAKNAGAEE